MKILSVDTSSKNCSVAIVDVDNNFNIITYDNSNDEKTHSQKLMPMIDNAFKNSNLSLDDIDLLACCVGPGSFTGIRIGIATVKAFADVKDIKTVAVTSLESLAYNVLDANYVVSLIDCKNENVYSSLFERIEKNYSQVGDNIADSIYNTLDKTISDLSNALSNSKNNSQSPINCSFVGDGSILYKDLITAKIAENSNLQNCNFNFSDDNTQSSISLAKCAYHKFLQGQFGDSNNLSPLYLRKSQAERALGGKD